MRNNNLINSKRYAFEISSDFDLVGVTYIQIPPRAVNGEWENVRVWITPKEKKLLELGIGPETYQAIFVGQSFNFPEIQWGDEVQIRINEKDIPVLDVDWLYNVFDGKILPVQKKKPLLVGMINSVRWQKALGLELHSGSEHLTTIRPKVNIDPGEIEIADFNALFSLIDQQEHKKGLGTPRPESQSKAKADFSIAIGSHISDRSNYDIVYPNHRTPNLNCEVM